MNRHYKRIQGIRKHCFINVCVIFFCFFVCFFAIITFLLDSPPTPGTPYPVTIKSTRVTIGWYELDCDGGHNISELVIQYREVKEFESSLSTYEYIYSIQASRREYTIYNLEPKTSYAFAVQAISSEFASSNFSEERVLNTLIAGLLITIVN